MNCFEKILDNAEKEKKNKIFRQEYLNTVWSNIESIEDRERRLYKEYFCSDIGISQRHFRELYLGEWN